MKLYSDFTEVFNIKGTIEKMFTSSNSIINGMIKLTDANRITIGARDICEDADNYFDFWVLQVFGMINVGEGDSSKMISNAAGDPLDGRQFNNNSNIAIASKYIDSYPQTALKDVLTGMDTVNVVEAAPAAIAYVDSVNADDYVGVYYNGRTKKLLSSFPLINDPDMDDEGKYVHFKIYNPENRLIQISTYSEVRSYPVPVGGGG